MTSTINWYHCRSSNCAFLIAAVVNGNKVLYQNISHLKGEWQKCKILHSGPNLLFFVQLLPTQTRVSNLTHPSLDPWSPTLFLKYCSQNQCICPARLFGASHPTVMPVFSPNTLTIVFCLTVLISFLSGSMSEFLPLIPVYNYYFVYRFSCSWFQFHLFLPRPFYSACPCSLPTRYLYFSLTSYHLLLPFSLSK